MSKQETKKKPSNNNAFSETDLHVWASTHCKSVGYRVPFAKIVDGDPAEAIILSQLAFKFSMVYGQANPDLVVKEGLAWIEIGYDDWWEEVGIKKDKARRAIEGLCAKNFVSKKVFRGRDGSPKVHLRVEATAIIKAVKNI